MAKQSWEVLAVLPWPSAPLPLTWSLCCAGGLNTTQVLAKANKEGFFLPRNPLKVLAENLAQPEQLQNVSGSSVPQATAFPLND